MADNGEDLRAEFDRFDLDGDGHISLAELTEIMQAIGEDDISEVRVANILREVDEDNNGQIEYEEFVAVVEKWREGQASEFGDVYGASSAKKAILDAIKKANEPPGKKERVWTPNATGGFHVQTARKVAGGPPPKRSLADLP